MTSFINSVGSGAHARKRTRAPVWLLRALAALSTLIKYIYRNFRVIYYNIYYNNKVAWFVPPFATKPSHFAK